MQKFGSIKLEDLREEERNKIVETVLSACVEQDTVIKIGREIFDSMEELGFVWAE